MVERIISALKKNSRYKDRVEHIEILLPKEPIYGELKKDLSRNIKNYLLKKSIKLYKHQCDAIESLRAGKSVIITTPTASGKTLAFNIPIFERLARDKSATALYLYPTKALSNDQLKVIKEFESLSGIGVNPNVYDGDTPPNKRPKIREISRIIISNPYELHQVLPWHYKWQKFFGNLKFVVIDEAHQYRGVFGSNVAFLIRRLRRICSFYGSEPQFILSTATLANPIEFGENLIGHQFNLISNDGSPKGKKYFIFYNPYFDGVGTLSIHQETKDLFLFFVRNNLQTLCFTVSRKMAELIALWSKKELKESESYLVDKITAYRAGYLPVERRGIENNLKNGILKGITSTNALELGIDVGSLDSVVISGYPGTIISTWQQAGRSGRGVSGSLATLVAFQNPLDQYFMRHPKIFFDKSHEHAIIDLSNPYIVSGHLMCAASELPIQLGEDGIYFGDDAEDILKALEKQGLVQDTPNGWVYSGKGRTTEAVSLANISSEIFKVICDGELLETMDRTQAYREAHKGAVLLHQGETYMVEDLDLKNSLVQVKKRDVDYYTEAMKVVDITIIEEIEKKEIGNFAFSFGDVEVNEQYVGYKIMKYDKVIGMEGLDLPPLNYKTMGLWFTIPEDIRKKIKDENLDFAGGLHGIEHAMIGIMPFHVMCDRWDLGGVSTSNHPDTMEPTIFIYDGFEGGIGLTEKSFELIVEIVKMTYELVRDCKCENGCPACIYSPKCGNGNKPLDKKGTILVLKKSLSKMGIEDV
ncbi:MAG: RNA helicase CrhR [candidate division WS2 bacterium]|uniref:RNA helicase CrhR n=1 Tax=Psychracetigena formicireducens TaxID=2986056 RepID=A0A9E2F7K3_PSYF1|nr:RNA helicase CrhR [Candidatus Psychracetigena formicireducens]